MDTGFDAHFYYLERTDAEGFCNDMEVIHFSQQWAKEATNP